MEKGKGTKICGNIQCSKDRGLEELEWNFGYFEQGEKKNALVKVSLCRKCEKKLNYSKRKKEKEAKEIKYERSHSRSRSRDHKSKEKSK